MNMENLGGGHESTADAADNISDHSQFLGAVGKSGKPSTVYCHSRSSDMFCQRKVFSKANIQDTTRLKLGRG